MIFMNKFFALILLAFNISSCSDMPYEAIVPMVRSTFIGEEKIEITDEFYDAQEYSFASVRIGKNISAILVLESINNNIYTWTSSGGNKLHTFKGKIIQTSGLERDVELYNYSLFSFIDGHTFNYEMMAYNPMAFIEMNSSINFDKSRDMYVEKMSSKVLTWKNENTFKIDSNGQVVFSRQVFHPFQPVIEMEFYYK